MHRQQKCFTAAAPPTLAQEGVRGALLHGLVEVITENARPRRPGPILERKQCTLSPVLQPWREKLVLKKQYRKLKPRRSAREGLVFGFLVLSVV
jgi:hypothetical protein